MRIASVAKAIAFSVLALSLSLFLTNLGGFFSSPDDAFDDVMLQRRLSESDDDHDANSHDDYLIIIFYHKTGHAISRSLGRIIKADKDNRFTNMPMNTLSIREHDKQTNCSVVSSLKLGMIHIQEAPDFYCDIETLAKELLQGEPSRTKKGIKIVHLVRNPFPLTVSHYKYHSQEPTPEPWVKGFDVCHAQEKFGKDEYDLLEPTLGVNGIMSYDDFNSVLDVCHSLFRSHPGLEKSGFYQHLLKLDPEEGIQLAATHMMRGRGGDLTRMANNIIKLRQLQEVEEQVNVAEHQLKAPKRIQVLTLATDDFTYEPRETASRFFDFALGGTSRESKEKMAIKYEERFNKTLNSTHRVHTMHITKGSDKAYLEEYMRSHEFFGRVLGNVEKVVESALEQSKDGNVRLESTVEQ